MDNSKLVTIGEKMHHLSIGQDVIIDYVNADNGIIETDKGKIIGFIGETVFLRNIEKEKQIKVIDFKYIVSIVINVIEIKETKTLWQKIKAFFYSLRRS